MEFDQKNSGFSNQCRALMYRNALFVSRNPRQLLESFSGLLILIMIILLRALVEPASKEPIKDFPRYNLTRFSPFWNDAAILVSPDAHWTRAIVSFAPELPLDRLVFVADSAALERRFKAERGRFLAGLQFRFKGPKRIDYDIRLPFRVAPVYSSVGPPTSCYVSNGLGTCEANSYLHSGFAFLQSALDAAIIRNLLPVEDDAIVPPTPSRWRVQMLPLPFLKANTIVLSFVIPLLLPLTVASLLQVIMVSLCVEKERKIKDSMRVMGMMESSFWISWSVVYLPVGLALASIITIVAKVGSFLGPRSDLAVFFLLNLLYCFSVVALAFFLSSFFRRSKTASAFGSMFVTMVTMLYLSVQIPAAIQAWVPVWAHWVLGLLSPVAFAQALNSAIRLDLADPRGLQFSNLDEIVKTGFEWKFSVADGILLLVVDSVVYMVLAIYLENVLPGTLGHRLHPLYFLSPSYWRSTRSSADEGAPLVDGLDADEVAVNVPETGRNVEPVAKELRGRDVLRIYHLTKEFSTRSFLGVQTITRAVDGFSLDVYEGHVTCLLGHNGAGKSTLINSLVGLVTPTSGTATFHGLDVTRPADLARVRRLTGLCPQSDVLFDDLTPEEHLVVLARFRGVAAPVSEAQRLLDAVGLASRCHTLVKKLTGGEKRKLSVAAALVGGPKFVLLDEPSAGLDPLSRRALWTLLEKEKKNRVILMTTHFMDEADILSDRKAIISDGKLKCVGSSLFLKNRFGIGYHLNMLLEDSQPAKAGDSSLGAVRTLVESFVPGAFELRHHGDEISFGLPLAEVAKFPPLFRALDDLTQRRSSDSPMSLRSYGVSLTSLEEVFLRIAEEREGQTDQGEEEKLAVRMAKGRFRKTSRSASPAVPTDASASQNGSSRSPPFSPNVAVNFVNGAEPHVVTSNSGNAGEIMMVQSPVGLVLQRFLALLRLRFSLLSASLGSIFYVFVVPSLMIVFGSYILTVNPGGVLRRRHDSGVKFGATHLGAVLYDADPAIPAFEASAVKKTRRASLVVADLDHDDAAMEALNRSGAGAVAAGLQTRGSSPGENQTLFYNVSIHLSIPETLNWVANSLAKIVDPNFSIFTTNLRLPLDRNDNPFASQSVFLIASALVFSLPIHATIDVVRDRSCKTRHQLRVMGVGVKTYWSALFVFDSLRGLVVVLVAIVSLRAFGAQDVSHGAIFSAVVFFFIFNIPLSILHGYVFSFAYDKHETCQSSLPGLLLLLSLVPYVLIQSLHLRFPLVSVQLHSVVGILFPTYNLYGGLYFLMQFKSRTDIVDRDFFLSDVFADSEIGLSFTAMIIWTIIFVTALPFLDARARGARRTCCGAKPLSVIVEASDAVELEGGSSRPGEDSDVARERRTVRSMNPQHSDEALPVVVRGVSKSFVKRSFWSRRVTEEKDAVNELSLAVGKGEIFGLLGPNGAGKSTTTSIIMAELAADEGQVFVAGHDVDVSSSKVFRNTGYCPQHNPLYDDLTVLGHLRLYAAIRGVETPRYADAAAQRLLTRLQLSAHAEKRVKALSGGTKRKLSFALSLLGDPEVVIMDEPSTGMDPAAKRFLWDAISDSFRGTSRGAILTTHSMEEADAICSRIGIMIKGELRCLGSAQHLKDKYGSGYSLEIKIKPSALTSDSAQDEAILRVHALMGEMFASGMPVDEDSAADDRVVVKENFGGKIVYKIPKDLVSSLADVFEALEQSKTNLDVEEYSFSQTTLEQVFLDLAKQQIEVGSSA